MTAQPALRTLAFGDLDGSVWGAGWFSDPDGSGLAMLGGAEASGVLLADERPAEQDLIGEWHLGDAGSLLVAPAGDPVAVQAPQERIEGYDQVCHVTGRVTLGGTAREVECVGVRTWFPGPIELERYESIRAVSTWFGEGEAMTLTAFRARKAKAHDEDAAAGALIGPEKSTPADDSRLSTTYEAGGWPVRAGLELWLPNAEDSEQQYPRRASGEASGARAEAQTSTLELRAEPFRWHSRGRDGAGMYILARRR